MSIESTISTLKEKVVEPLKQKVEKIKVIVFEAEKNMPKEHFDKMVKQIRPY